MLNSYKSWVRSNANFISYAESGLSSLTYLLPDRFASSELLCEGLNALVGLLGVWHDSILYEPVHANSKGRQYQLYLAALQQVETLIELRALHLERQGKMSCYGPLAVLEFCKATLRLLLLLPQEPGQLLVSESIALTPSGPIEAQQSAVQQRFKHVQEALDWFRRRHTGGGAGRLGAGSNHAPVAPPLPSKAKKGESEHGGLGYSVTGGRASSRGEIEPCNGDNDASASSKQPSALSHRSQDQPRLWWADEEPQTSPPPSTAAPSCTPSGEAEEASVVDWEIQFGHNLLLLGEVLYLYRPVLYVLLLKRYGRKSWSPWVASLCVDLLSRTLIAKAGAMLSAATGRQYPQHTSLCSLALLKRFSTFHWSAGEEREMSRRRVLLLYYLLRSPFFDSVTRPFVKRAQRPLSHVPIVGSISEKMLEILEGVQHYYTYTSAS